MWVTGRTIQYPSTRWLQLGSNACVSSFNSCMYIRAVFNQTGQGSLHILSVTCMFGAALLDFSDGWETLKPTSLMGTDYRLCLHTTNEQTAFSLCLFAQIYRYCRHNRNRRMCPQSPTRQPQNVEAGEGEVETERANSPSVHTPLLEENLRERSLDWRRGRLETDWPRTRPYCGTVGGRRPDTGGYVWSYTQSRITVVGV